jgi:hypothetical protein
MSTYLEISDIKDAVIRGQDIETYMSEADEAIEDLAERLEVPASDIEIAPLHYKVRRYGVAYVLMRFCQDRISAASADQPPEQNKYAILYGMYKRELKDLDGEISYEMVAGSVNRLRDRANLGTATIFRG